MLLTYRGQIYQHRDQLVETEINTFQMTYRGQTFGHTSHYLVRSPVYQPYRERLNLVYRGCAYSTEYYSTGSPQHCNSPNFVSKLTENLGI
jgi:hypothetical protein